MRLPAVATVAFTSFATAVCYAACFPSLAPFLAHLEGRGGGSTSAMLGLAVAESA